MAAAAGRRYRTLRTRRLVAGGALVALVALAAATGFVAGQLTSPEVDVAGPASPVVLTRPVVESALETAIVSRVAIVPTTQQNLTVTPRGGTPAIVTVAPPAAGATLREGDVLLEIAGRPVFLFAGELPAYRDLLPGAQGPDVAQLAAGLVRLGLLAGVPAGDTLSPQVEAAIEQLYEDAGYTPAFPSADDARRLAELELAVDRARNSVRSAEAAVARAAAPLPRSALLQLENSVRLARRALADAQDQQAAQAEELRNALEEARAALAEAEKAADTARSRLQQAGSGVHPDTGLPPTPTELDQLRADVATADAALELAQADVVTAEQDLADASEQNARQVEDRQRELDILVAQLEEATTPPDLTDLRTQLEMARQELADARSRLAAADAEIGVGMPAAELVFAQSLPATVAESYVERGSTVNGAVVRLDEERISFVGELPSDEAQLIEVGQTAVLDDPQSGFSLPATVSAVAERPGTLGAAVGRHHIEVIVTDAGVPREALPLDMRITIPVSLADHPVPAIPVAALRTRPDGVTVVELQEADGTRHEVDVTVGLRAGGLVEIDSPAVAVGDRVVVGVIDPSRSADADASP